MFVHDQLIHSYVDYEICKTDICCSLFLLIYTSFWHLNVFLGFFVDINLFKADKEKAAEISKNNSINESGNTSSEKDDFADEDANLMVKLKFLTYKVYTPMLEISKKSHQSNLISYEFVWWHGACSDISFL